MTDYVPGTDRLLGSSGNSYEALFTDKTDNSIMDQSDFIKLMITELQNQDFTNPVDNSEMISQMATFSNLQAMQEMSSYAKTLYAAGLVGKTVTASRYTVSGGLDTTTGVVQKISLVDDEYVIYVGGKTYTLPQIMQIGGTASGSDITSTVDASNFKLLTGETTTDSVALEWEVPTEDKGEMIGVSYDAYYSTDSNFDTVEQVEAGTKVADAISGTTVVAAGLESNTTYYFNVVATDAKGNKTVYPKVMAKTRA